ncbi:MAG: hypothetical protein K940chlam3_01190 [Chlamydiae bacterium]|nr:hypothetical protein [Chlamydiota bacterium]
MIQNLSHNPFPVLPYEISTMVFGQLDPSFTPTLSLVSKTWKNFVEDNQTLHRTWKTEYTLNGEINRKPFSCLVQDHTGIASVRSVEIDPDTTEPKFDVKIKNHCLSLDERKYLQPEYDCLREKPLGFWYRISDQITLRKIDADIVEISEHDTDDKNCVFYVDTSFEYKTEEKIYYFVYDFWPHITDPNADNRIDKLFSETHLSEHRCFQNRFGTVIEGHNDQDDLRIFYAKPDDTSFQELDQIVELGWLMNSYAVRTAKETDEYVLSYMKEHHSILYKMSRKKKWVKPSDSKRNYFLRKPSKSRSAAWLRKNMIRMDTPEGYYGPIGYENRIILVNYDSPTKEIIPYLNGEPAKTIKQTDGFTLTYPVRTL